jgi:hypothetical protein
MVGIFNKNLLFFIVQFFKLEILLLNCTSFGGAYTGGAILQKYEYEFRSPIDKASIILYAGEVLSKRF